MMHVALGSIAAGQTEATPSVLKGCEVERPCLCGAVLRAKDIPTPGRGEVLVQVYASNINPAARLRILEQDDLGEPLVQNCFS